VMFISINITVYDVYVYAHIQRTLSINCVCTGLGVMTWSPLAGGFLTGKYEDGVPLYSRASMKVLSIFSLDAIAFMQYLVLINDSF